MLENFLRSIGKNENIKNFDNFAKEFKNNAWYAEGSLKLLSHYEITFVITDSASSENLQSGPMKITLIQKQ